MGLWARFQKARSISDYLGRCPDLFLTRYGYEQHYSIERVLATLAAEKLNVTFADYACALFCHEADFVAWVLRAYRDPSQMPSARRKLGRRGDGIHSILASPSEPSAVQASELYHSLREEVALRSNNGSHQFLREPISTFGEVPPLRVSSVRQTGFRWYR